MRGRSALVRQKGRTCVGSLARGNIQRPQEEEAGRQKKMRNGTAARRVKAQKGT